MMAVGDGRTRPDKSPGQICPTSGTGRSDKLPIGAVRPSDRSPDLDVSVGENGNLSGRAVRYRLNVSFVDCGHGEARLRMRALLKAALRGYGFRAETFLDIPDATAAE